MCFKNFPRQMQHKINVECIHVSCIHVFTVKLISKHLFILLKTNLFFGLFQRSFVISKSLIWVYDVPIYLVVFSHNFCKLYIFVV